MNISTSSNYTELELNETFDFLRYNDQPHHTLCKAYDLVIECILFTIFILFGFVGNSLSIICLWKDNCKTATPALLINLEVAETLFLLTALLYRSVPTAYDFAGGSNPTWKFTYQLVLYPLTRLFQTCAIYTTLLVTVNRYVVVCHPYSAKNLCSKNQAKGQIVMVWIFSVLYNIPLFYEYQFSKDHLLIESRFSKSFNILYNNVSYFIVMFFIPLLSLIFLNYNLVVALRRMKRRKIRMKLRVNKDLSNRKSSTSTANRSEEEITYVLIVIVFVFLFSQTPALLTQVLKLVYDSYYWYLSCPSFYFFFERISDMLVVITSSVNFLIYIFGSSKFFKILLSLLGNVKSFCCRKNKGVVGVAEERTNLSAMKAAAGLEEQTKEQVELLVDDPEKY